MRISLIVAVDEGGVMGNNNALPWHLPEDLLYFKNKTWGMPILMGRKTFESIGKPLPGRQSIVITRNRQWKGVGVTAVQSLDEAITEAKRSDVKEIFIIGGAEIFLTSLSQANRIYLTRIHHRFEGDVFFPQLDGGWKLSSAVSRPEDAKNPYARTYQTWER